jgi:hypothetical protein
MILVKNSNHLPNEIIYTNLTDLPKCLYVLYSTSIQYKIENRQQTNFIVLFSHFTLLTTTSSNQIRISKAHLLHPPGLKPALPKATRPGVASLRCISSTIFCYTRVSCTFENEVLYSSRHCRKTDAQDALHVSNALLAAQFGCWDWNKIRDYFFA